MTTELPTQSVVAIATLVAALITGAISFVNLTLTKELKTSEFRQAWIDGLREELAAFFGAARSFARVFEGIHAKEKNSNLKLTFSFTDEKVSELRYQAAETFSKIKLRLNPDEPEHTELLRLLKRSIDEQNKMLENKSDAIATLNAIELANEYARPVLKKEWDRVKKGEFAFRAARNWVAPAIVLLSIAFIAFLLNVKFC